MQATHPATTVFTCPYCEHKNELSEIKDGEVITCGNPMCQRQFQAELPKVHPDPELIVPGAAATDTGAEATRDVPHAQPVNAESKPDTPEATPATVTVPEAPATGTSVAAPETPTIVATYRAPMLARHPVRFLINLGLTLLGIAGLVWAFNLGSHLLGAFSLIPLVYGVGRQFAWWLRARNFILTVTTRGVVISQGLFTVNQREYYHEAIHGIHIFQPWWARLAGTGALMIDTGDKGDEVYLDAVPHPHRVAEQIREQAKK